MLNVKIVSACGPSVFYSMQHGKGIKMNACLHLQRHLHSVYTVKSIIARI